MIERQPTGSSEVSPGRTAASRLFRPDRLSIGLALPVRADPAGQPDSVEQIRIARHAEAVGLDAVWVRDVPLNGDWYPEAFGHPDPFVTLGAAAAVTERIVLGTAATVLTLRHPLHVAKAAVSLQHLSGDRFVLGLGSNDRPEEFAAFEASTGDRRALFRDHWRRLAQALEHPQSVEVASAPNAAYALRPPPLSPLTRLAVGSSGQTLEWIARNAAGWATYHRPAEIQRDRHALWRRAVEANAPDVFRSFSVAMGGALDPDPDTPLEPMALGVKGGARRLADELEAMRLSGVHHVILNLAPGPVSPEQGLELIGHALAGDANRASVAKSLAQQLTPHPSASRFAAHRYCLRARHACKPPHLPRRRKPGAVRPCRLRDARPPSSPRSPPTGSARPAAVRTERRRASVFDPAGLRLPDHRANLGGQVIHRERLVYHVHAVAEET